MRGTAAAVLGLVAALLCGAEPAFAQLPALRDRPLSAAERTRLAALEVNFTRISTQRNTSVAALRTIARSLGQRLTTQDPDQLVRAIDERAHELGAARERIQSLEGELEQMDSMRLARAAAPLLAAAGAAIEAGDLAAAEARLAEAAERFAEARLNLQSRVDDLSGREADILAQQAAVRASAFDFRGAATLYARAAELTPAADAQRRWRRLMEQGEALLRQGDDFAELAALGEAAAVFRDQALPLAPREQRPRDWASTQHRLGQALSLIGERGADNAAFDAAITALRAAVEATPRDAAPRDWADRRRNLGVTLSIAGDRTSDVSRMQEGIAVLRDTPPELASEPATLRTNLGAALGRLALHTGSAADMAAAADVFRAALAAVDRSAQPREWATLQLNLGAVLAASGFSQEGEASIRAYEAATAATRTGAEAVDRRQSPFLWAQLRRNLGSQLVILSDRHGDAGGPTLAAALAELRAAEAVYTRDQAPRPWAALQADIGNALSEQARRGASAALYEQAIAASEAAQSVYTRETSPAVWAQLRTTNADRLGSFAELSPAPERVRRLEQARDMLVEALAVARTVGSPPVVERAERGIAEVTAALAAARGP